MSSAIIFCIICVLVLYFAKYAQLWLVRTRLGLPGPPPSLPYIGDILFLLTTRHKDHEYQLQLLKKYGRNVAYTRFGKVYILISDPELIKSVYIKNFDYFPVIEEPGRKITKPPYTSMISVSPRWRHIRNVVSPIFSTSMLKHMMVLMRQSVATLVRKIEKDSAQDTVVDVHEHVKEFTMEVSVNVSFSIDADIQVNKENPFMKNAKLAQMGANFVQLLASLPFLEYFSSLLSNLDGYDYVTSTARKIIKQRRQGIGGTHQDFLQMLLNTQKDEDKKLTDSEIVAQSLIFPLTGFHSTSSAASFLIYILSLHPEIQEKVRKEVDDVWPNSQNELTYEILQNTPYLDMCYQESQRLYSAGHIGTRICTEDCEINGIQFKKGMVAVLPIYATHRLPEIWPEPDKFIPERFTPEAKANRSQYVFMPFSHGPRNCVGMRFATLNVKLIVVSLLKKFVIAKTEKTMDPITFSSDVALYLPKGSTSVKFLPRKGNNDAI